MLELGLHPRAIDAVQAALADPATRARADAAAGAAAAGSATASGTMAVTGGAAAGAAAGRATAAAAAGAASADAQHAAPLLRREPSGGGAAGSDLSLKDRQWRRPKRPTAAEASAAATGGGLYGDGAEAAKVLTDTAPEAHAHACIAPHLPPLCPPRTCRLPSYTLAFECGTWG